MPLLLGAALAIFWTATARRIAHVHALTQTATWSVDPVGADPSSSTGFERGQRMLIVPGQHSPSFSWIAEAQNAAKRGQLRVRRIAYDAQPDGREIRRTALYRWWLEIVGGVRGLIMREPLGLAIGRGTLVADAVLFALFLIGGALYTARYLGSLPAVGFVVAAMSIFPLSAGFQPGAPDPHALAYLLALGSVLPLFSDVRKQGGDGRWHFALAGLCGGLGFWNDVFTQGPILVAVGLGALASELIGTEASNPTRFWRTWALAGAVTVLVGSAFEFFPNYLSWALDAVSPIHAVAWWGVGEVLHTVATWKRDGVQRFGPHAFFKLISCAIAIGLWPAAFFIHRSNAFLAADFYARELANQRGAGFALNTKAWLHQADEGGVQWATLLPSLLIFVTAIRAITTRKDRSESGRLIFVSILLVGGLILAWQQLRWWNLFDVFAITGVVVLARGWGHASAEARACIVMSALLMIPGLFVAFPSAPSAEAMKNISPGEAESLVERDFAHWLAVRHGSDPTVLFSTPIFSGAVGYYGGFDTIVSGDDTNETGFRSAVRIASTDTPEEAQRLLRLQHVTCVALPLWDPALDQLVRIGTNLPAGQAIRVDTFVGAMKNWDSPVWMRPLSYMVPESTGLQGFELRVYTLGADQDPDLALSRLVNVLIERGEVENGDALRQVLAQYPRSLYALAATANLDLSRNDRAHAAETLEKLTPLLSRRWARMMPIDQRISLAALFVQTRHLDLARDQIAATLKDLDEENMRLLTLGSTIRLLALSRAFSLPFPNPTLEATAKHLIPPSLRAQVKL